MMMMTKVINMYSLANIGLRQVGFSVLSWDALVGILVPMTHEVSRSEYRRGSGRGAVPVVVEEVVVVAVVVVVLVVIVVVEEVVVVVAVVVVVVEEQ